MKDNNLYSGDSLLISDSSDVSLTTVDMNNESYFKIDHYNEMPPFFMTIVNDGDFWLFVSSTGGLTAGRKNPDTALFPYVTDDKVHDSIETTGPDTAMIVYDGDRHRLWKPFTNHNANLYKITRNLYKNTIGNKIMFEEVNLDLQLTYRYTWKMSSRYGLIKASEIVSHAEKNLEIRLLDGIRNILPYGVEAIAQSSRSTLIDGYKRSELMEDSALGIFTLSSIISDKAEPSESLKATTVWTKGLSQPTFLLSEQQVASFLNNHELVTESDVKGRRGAFYASSTFELNAAESRKWYFISELDQSAADIEALISEISDSDLILDRLEADVSKGDENLKKLVYDADGFQMTKKKMTSYRHFSNTLYNIMRGGIYADGYTIDTKDLRKFIENWNAEVFRRHFEALSALPEEINAFDLLEEAEKREDSDLQRIVREYLPLFYSRRHGDPSRPWNKFNIGITGEDGEQNLNFEGNWRDIFQNWEALSLSFPGYIENIIAKFVNASTADGYNPYRITKEGVDWEEPDPEDPWSNIGYWGDHQVIYLLKLMEMSKKYNPEKLTDLLKKDIFVYSNVPYRITGLDELIKDPRNTIDYDEKEAKLIEERVLELGADGKLQFADDKIHHVNLMEKLLAVMLSKLSNFVPKGGIWMNTQRPEWNDANNALVGNGVSMVTLYYLYRYLSFMGELLEGAEDTVQISVELKEMFDGISAVLKDSSVYLEKPMSDEVRYEMLRKLGGIGETYRERIYTNGFSGEKLDLTYASVKEMVETAKMHLYDTITSNKREDSLYHAYNLLRFRGDTCSISYLYEMLEGQVAVLSSGALSAAEALNVLDALKKSAIYREDQRSYMLYPVRELPRFLKKNIIPKEMVKGSKALETELENGSKKFIEEDVKGQYRFNGQFRNASEIMEAMTKDTAYDEEDIKKVGEIFSDLFEHHAFTGRSGTFYKYEGLGSIYWHMVSKLVLAAKENHELALAGNEESIAEKLAEHFHELKAGIGAEKSPVEYGAFPSDAYSHTPSFAGVQQPGMTGQVKEDIISRFFELGVNVSNGEIIFDPRLLSDEEYLEKPSSWELPGESIEIGASQLGFTLCSVPVIYELNDHKAVTVCYKNGDRYTFENIMKLNKEISRCLFRREGKIDKIFVQINT